VVGVQLLSLFVVAVHAGGRLLAVLGGDRDGSGLAVLRPLGALLGVEAPHRSLSPENEDCHDNDYDGQDGHPDHGGVEDLVVQAPKDQRIRVAAAQVSDGRRLSPV